MEGCGAAQNAGITVVSFTQSRAPMSASPAILITRPEAAARRFGEALRAAGCDAPQVIAPILDIQPVAGALASSPLAPGAARGVILSSVHGVAGFAAQTALRPPAWCVGQSTARAARDAGFDVQAAAEHADDLFRLMVGAGSTGPFLHPRGRHARGALAQRLAEAGLPATEVVIYEQNARPLGADARALLLGGAPVIAPVFSPRTARLLAEAAQGATAPLHLVAISDAAAQAWREFGAEPGLALRIARRPDADAMVEATMAAAKAACAP
jgi:uroporphyrinogen-III synthase